MLLACTGSILCTIHFWTFWICTCPNDLHFPTKNFFGGSFGGCNSDPVNPSLTKPGEQVEKSQMEIPCKFDICSLHRISSVYSWVSTYHFPRKHFLVAPSGGREFCNSNSINPNFTKISWSIITMLWRGGGVHSSKSQTSQTEPVYLVPKSLWQFMVSEPGMPWTTNWTEPNFSS